MDLKKDKNICVHICVLIFKLLLVQFEFNEINRLVLKPNRTDKNILTCWGSEVYDLVHIGNISSCL